MSRNGHLPLCMAPITPPHIRQDWDFERVTTPRKPCVQALTLRNQLRTLMPGEHVIVAGKLVKRLEAVSLSGKYSIDRRGRYTLEDALAQLADEGSVAA